MNPRVVVHAIVLFAACTAFQYSSAFDSVEVTKSKAEKGSAESQYSMGVYYLTGTWVIKDYEEAAKWFRKSADQGLAKSQAAIGLLSSMGDGVTKDKIEAVKWFRLAADQGNPLAQRHLGLACANGEGTTKDFVESYKWFNLSAAQGDDDSKSELDKLERKITKEQVAEGQRLSREFRPKKLVSK